MTIEGNDQIRWLRHLDERDEQVETEDHESDNSPTLRRPDVLLTRGARVRFHEGAMHPNILQLLDTLDQVEMQPIQDDSDGEQQQGRGWTNIGEPVYERTPDSPVLWRQRMMREAGRVIVDGRQRAPQLDLYSDDFPMTGGPYGLVVHMGSKRYGYVLAEEDMPGR